MWFGPVMERRSRTVVDWSPVDPERTEKLLAERESVTVGDVREFLASTQQGLGAIEHGLFGDEPAVLEQLSQRNGIGCRYLTGLGEVVADETANVLSDWTGDGTDGRSYAAYLNGTRNISLLD